jgi:hypothetical protein
MPHFARLEEVRERDFLRLGTAIFYLRKNLPFPAFLSFCTIRVHGRAIALASILLTLEQSPQDLETGIDALTHTAAFPFVQILSASLAQSPASLIA